MSSRFENDEQTRNSSGFSASTYGTIFGRFKREEEEVGCVSFFDFAHFLTTGSRTGSLIARMVQMLKFWPDVPDAHCE